MCYAQEWKWHRPILAQGEPTSIAEIVGYNAGAASYPDPQAPKCLALLNFKG